MKKIYYLLFSFLLFTACEEISSIPEEFTFTLNGSEMNFSDNVTVSKDWLSGEIEITGKKAGVGKVIITLHEPEEGEYNENDYLFNASEYSYNYTLWYTDVNDNVYTYKSSSVTNRFNINVEKFQNRIDGEVSGEFSGFLDGSLFNNSSAVDSIVIENGIFSTKLTDKL